MLETVWILFSVPIVIGIIMMYFLSDRGIFEMHSKATDRKNNDEMAKKTHKKVEGYIPNSLLI